MPSNRLWPHFPGLGASMTKLRRIPSNLERSFVANLKGVEAVVRGPLRDRAQQRPAKRLRASFQAAFPGRQLP